jgi:carboxymethylenebutenolidase
VLQDLIMSGQDVVLESDDGGTFDAYLVASQNTPALGIVLLQEIFGVNAVMRRQADELAGAGFMVIVPDLFWRQQPRVQLDPAIPGDRDTAMRLLEGLDEAMAIADASKCMRYLRKARGCNGKVAALGFCLGGRLAFLMAARTNIDAAVSFYGTGLDKAAHEAATIGSPVLLHIAEQDSVCPPEAQRAILRVHIPAHGDQGFHDDVNADSSRT